jgi:carbonic anhydrase
MKDWSFKESLEWKSKFVSCNNSIAQSPINIDTELAITCSTLCDLKIHYKPSKCRVKFNNGMLSLYYDGGSYIIYKNVYYKLDKITIHTPSMHTIDHEKYAMEVCLFHNAGNATDGGVIIHCLYEEGPHYGSPDTFFNQFINDTPAFNIDFEDEIEVSSMWGANMLLPKQRSFYVYNGSIPFPPCSENYYNIVMDTTGHIGSTNLNLLKKYLGKNVRNVQQLNNRKVFYSSGESITMAEREVNVTNDRFLRCSKKPDEVITTKAPIETTTKAPVDNSSAFTIAIKQRIQSIFVLLTIFMVILNAFFFVKYLFKTKRAQNAIYLMVGRANYGNLDIRPIWENKCVAISNRHKIQKGKITGVGSSSSATSSSATSSSATSSSATSSSATSGSENLQYTKKDALLDGALLGTDL